MILQPQTNDNEKVTKIIYSKLESTVDSHHDIILSQIDLPYIGGKLIDNDNNLKAPRVENTRHKIKWSDTGIIEYETLIAPALISLQENWFDPSSSSSTSVLMSATNEF